MYANLTTISNERCQFKWAKKNMSIESFHICTTSPVGVGPCYGDSGGALELNGKLIGIISFGWPCATSIPDGYVRVSYYKDWINSIVEEENVSH